MTTTTTTTHPPGVTPSMPAASRRNIVELTDSCCDCVGVGILRKKDLSVILPQKTYNFSSPGQPPSGRPYTSPTAVIGAVYLFIF